MRNIEVRGWDREKEEMVYEDSPGVVLSMIRDGFDIIPTLFTGMYDYVRKKVFDGDIVEVEDTLYVVFYSEKECTVLFVNSMVSIPVKNFLGKKILVLGHVFDVEDQDNFTDWHEMLCT